MNQRRASIRANKLSLAFRKNKNMIQDGRFPSKYVRIADVVAGTRVMELGSAEGVLALLLAERGKSVLGIEASPERHAAALELGGIDAIEASTRARVKFVLGDIRDSYELMEGYDAFVASRSIYYLRDEIEDLMKRVSESFTHVTLVGNYARERRFFKSRGSGSNSVGRFEYYATGIGMQDLLSRHGYRITNVIFSNRARDPIVCGQKP